MRRLSALAFIQAAKRASSLLDGIERALDGLEVKLKAHENNQVALNKR